MKMHRNRTFAPGVKLSTSGVTHGNLSTRGVRVDLGNGKGALRMNLGMQVRGGLLAALILVAAPVAGSLAAMLVPSSAAAQTLSSIEVQGNRRVEIETDPLLFQGRPDGRLDQAAIDDGLKALIETGLFEDVKINRAGGRLVVVVVENPVINRVAFEGNKKIKDEAA